MSRVSSITLQVLVPAGEAPLFTLKDEHFTVVIHPEEIAPAIVAAHKSRRHEERLAGEIVRVHHVQGDPGRIRHTTPARRRNRP